MAPGVPLNLSGDDFGATWVVLCWLRPSDTGQPGIAKYIVSATPEFEDPEDAETFISTLTRLNMTDLLPNVTYKFRVQAVALSLDVKNPSLPSGPETITTATTGEIAMCNIHTAFCRIFAADQ